MPKAKILSELIANHTIASLKSTLFQSQEKQTFLPLYKTIRKFKMPKIPKYLELNQFIRRHTCKHTST